METRNLGYASTNDRNGSNPLKLLGVPASSIPFYSPGDFCETSLRLHSIRKLLSHPRDKASQFQRYPILPLATSLRRLCRRLPPPRGTVFNSIYNRTAKYRSWQLLVRCRSALLLCGMTSRSRKHSYSSFQKSIATPSRHRGSNVRNKALSVFRCKIQ